MGRKKQKIKSSPPWIQVRILPLTITLAVLLLLSKAVEVHVQFNELSLISEATAEEEKKPEVSETTGSEAPKEEAKKEDKEAKKDDEEKTAEEDKPKEGEEAKGEHGEGEKKEENKNVSEEKPVDKGAKPEFTQIEVDLLQNLSKRREELDSWSKDVEMKEEVLKATEQRIDHKITEIQSLKKEVEALLASYNEKEDAKIRSLVKIYENMKPDEAARIFEEMDMPILLAVVDRMSERKVAPVLANMSPKKAKEVTTELAEQRQIKQPNTTALQ